MMNRDKTKKGNAGYVLKVFFKMMKLGMPRYLVGLAGITLIGLGSFLFSLFMGLILSNSLEHFTAGTSAVNSTAYILIFMIIVTVASALGYFLNLQSAMNIRAKIQQKLVSAWIRQTEAFASMHHSSESMTLVTTDMEILEDFYYQGLRGALFLPLVEGAAVIITIFAVDWRLLLPSLAAGIISMLISISFSGRIQQKNRVLRSASDEMTHIFSENITSNETNRNLGTTDLALSRYQTMNLDYVKKAVDAKKTSNNLQFIGKLLDAVSTIAFFGIGLALAEQSVISIADILLVYPILGGVGYMIRSLGEAWNYIVTSTTSGERIVDALNWPQEKDSCADSDITAVPEMNTLSLKNIHFGYEKDKPVLKGMSFDIKKGQTVALVGESGGGKTTVFQLLLKFYHPDEGDIAMDNISSDQYTLSSWRANFVYLQQETPLLIKTIRENIAMGLYGSGRNPSDDEIIRAAKAAGAHEFITKLPQGYDTPIDERGGNLSGGQRQRIAIARAFLSNAPIVLLDEPTAALDAESEKIVQQSLESLMRERTVLVVAHRLETVQNADQILVLENGGIIEQGTHEELMRLGGRYAGLYSLQPVSRSE